MVGIRSHTKKLPAGGHIVVIGGGPAGSFSALFALYYASQLGLRLTVTIFEPRDFSRTGPWGCNMCAGLIPIRVLRELEKVGVSVPAHIIRERISHYTLHTIGGQICLPQPDPDGDVVSVYRGGGPLCALPWPHPISFDGFLLDTARTWGAEVVHERVTTVSLFPRPIVETRTQRFPADLVVLATGINAPPIHFTDLPYSPPPRQQMAQTEICLESEQVVKQTLNNSVHIFLPPDNNLRFGTLIPKGHCISVSLLGNALPRGTIARFLALPEVARLLPDIVPRACGCRPRIAVGAAHPLFADRFVAVGDAGITRLYKDGIGTALRTARQAAFTAVCHGISQEDFNTFYAPLCQKIAWDNRAGRFLFMFTRLFQHHPWFANAFLRSVAAEQALPSGKRLHSRLLWGMFTGTYSYQELLVMACNPRIPVSFFRRLMQEIIRQQYNYFHATSFYATRKRDFPLFNVKDKDPPLV